MIDTDWDDYGGSHLSQTGLQGFGAFATPQDITAARMRADLDELMTESKTLGMAMIGLQAVAAFAALGIFIVQVRALSKRKNRKGKR